MTKPIFINTRPPLRQNALPQVERVADVVSLPLIELKKRPLSDDDKAVLARLCAGGYDVVVVVSITAVEWALSCLSDDELGQILQLNQGGKLCFVAVGKPTANALRAVGLTVETPPVASNESMSQMAIFANAKNVLFWRGVGGRVFLMNDLQKRGVAVAKVDFYERGILDVSKPLAQLLERGQKMVVLISSEMAWQAWQEAVACVGAELGGFEYLAMGERLGAMIHGAKVIYELDDETLAKAVGA